jgi:pimeloyl-ACP methyl ester carboxylesterase
VAGGVSARLNPYLDKVVYKFIALGKAFPPAFALFRRVSRYRWGACSRYSRFRPWFCRMSAVRFEDWAIDRDMAFQPKGQVPAYRAGQAIHALDLTDQPARITAPTLAIMGRQDAVVIRSDGRLIGQQIPNSRLVWIDECGHFPMYEKTAEYLETVHTWLAEEEQI